jgi:hypothetical protein
MAQKHTIEFFPNRLVGNASWPRPRGRLGMRLARSLPLNHQSTP